MAVWGGRTGQRAFEFLSREEREGGEVAERRIDNSPAIYGWVRCQSNRKVPQGTAENFFRPWRDFGRLWATSPSHKWLGYCQGQRRDAENGHRDGRAPRQSPSRAANGSLGWTNGGSSLLLSFLESVPEVDAKLKDPNTKDEAFEEVVKSAQDAAVLVLVY